MKEGAESTEQSEGLTHPRPVARRGLPEKLGASDAYARDPGWISHRANCKGNPRFPTKMQ